MKALQFSLTALLMFALTSDARADRIGNGGGGIFDEQTGEYKTFYGAGFYVEPAYLTDADLPDLVKLRQEVKALQLSPKIHAKFLQAMVPTYNRKFFKVAAHRFSREEYEKIKDEYRRVYKDDRINIAIYAITEGSTTYILPEFYKLKANDRLLILFHEMLWTLAPGESYQEILRVDDYMNRYIKERTQSAQFQLIAALDRLLVQREDNDDSFYGGKTNPTPASLFGFAFGSDMKTGALKGLVGGNGSLSLDRFLGADALECYRAQSRSDSSGESCVPAVKSHWYNLSQQYPKSLFLQALLGGTPVVSGGSGYEVGSGNAIQLVSTGASVNLSQKDLYNGMIMISARATVWRQTCADTLFQGRKCTNTKVSVPIRIPLFSFTDKIWIRDLEPISWTHSPVR